MSRRRQVAVLAAVTAALAGCGGSNTGVTVISPAASRPNSGGASSTAIALAKSSNGPTSCTVYEAGYATQVTFASRSLDVRAECQAWVRNPGDGYLWGYQPPNPVTKAGEATQFCSLMDPQRNVTARVIEDTAFLPVSAAQRARGTSTCASILAAGWTRGKSDNV